MLEWPEKKADGKFGTTGTAIEVWKAVAKAADDPRKEQTLAKLEACKKTWRTDYIPILEEIVKLMAEAEPQVAVAMAEAGLNKIQDSMMFHPEGDSEAITSNKAFELESIKKFGEPLKTLTYHGTQDGYSQFPIASPTGEWLTGDDATKQAKAYASYGCMEESAAHHVEKVCNTAQCKDLLLSSSPKKHFVLLGATSSMGPSKSLLQVPGASVLGIARKGKRLDALVDWFQTNGAKDATLQVPESGGDLLSQGPSIAQWIVETVPPNQEIVLCMLCYMDGEAHVRISVVVDLIVEYVRKHYKGKVSLSFLSSPATVYVIPPEVAKASHERFTKRPFWHTMASSLGYWLKPTNVWSNGGLINGLSGVQGPNYALAKTMQQWRCMVAYYRDDLTVSSPHAPATRTESMIRYSTIAAALEGSQYFEPMMAFDVDAASSLMTAVLLYQITQPDSICHPSQGKDKQLLKHPFQLFWDGSVHGGSWGCPYTTDSSGTLSFLMGKVVAGGNKYVPKRAIVVAEEGSETAVDSAK